MLAFGRAIGIFFLMIVVGYLAVVLMLPPPAITHPDALANGQSDAARLTEQAQALVTHKPAASLD